MVSNDALLWFTGGITTRVMVIAVTGCRAGSWKPAQPAQIPPMRAAATTAPDGRDQQGPFALDLAFDKGPSPKRPPCPKAGRTPPTRKRILCSLKNQTPRAGRSSVEHAGRERAACPCDLLGEP